MLSHRLSRCRRIHTRVRSNESGSSLCVCRNGSNFGGLRQLHPHHDRVVQHSKLTRPASLVHESQFSTIARETYSPSKSVSTLSKSLQPSQPHHDKHQFRFNTTAAAANISINQKNEQEGSSISKHHSNPRTSNDFTKRPAAYVVELTQRLLSMPSPTAAQQNNNNYPLRNFEQILANTRTNKSVLKVLQLSPDEAGNMFILPPKLLKDVHAAIMHFSRADNYHGITIPVNKQASSASEGFAKYNKKVPGPMLCARLLELIGIPHYYLHVSLSSLPNVTTAPNLIVHSSQIDLILESCLQTNIALSRSCEPGKHSLIGSDFNDLQSNSRTGGEKKTASQLCEEIWRSVCNLQIKYTSGRKEKEPPTNTQVHTGSYFTRYFDNASSASALLEYLYAARGADVNETEEDDAHDYADGLSDTTWAAMTTPEESEEKIHWSPKDQRRYDKSVVLFNTVLAAYAKLSSSASGIQPAVRRDMMQNCERLLLEMVDRADTQPEPSPSTILQCLQPNVVSFNTTMKAISDWAPRDKDDGETSVGKATAERTESILGMMQEIWDEGRANRTTLQSWKEAGDPDGRTEKHAPPPRYRAIAPNASSYSNVLKAWTNRSSDPDTALRALKVCRTMLNRNNVACLATKESLILENPERRGNKVREELPVDSRTFVLLLQCLQSLPLSIGFRDAFDTIESIYDSMKQWDGQMKWSVENNTHVKADKRGDDPILNVFSYNTLIKTLSKLPTNWKESHECCLRIEDIIEEMNSSVGHNVVMQCLPNIITAWTQCAKLAGDDKERSRLCAEKSGAHIDTLLMRGNGASATFVIRAINDTISLYGRAGMPSEADELFLRAKACNRHNLGTLSNCVDSLSLNAFQSIAHVEKANKYLFDFEQDKMRMSRASTTPDMKFTKMYNSVLAGYINCDRKKRGLEQSQALLAHMVSSHESNLRHIARPNTTSFARVMSALSASGDNTQRLEELLSKMEAMQQRSINVPKSSPDAELVANVAPNIVIYNLLLKSYSRSEDDGALQSAMRLLGRMEADSDIKPDNISNSYITALLSRQDGAVTATDTSSSSENDKLVSRNLTNLDIGSLNLVDGNRDPTSKTFKSIIMRHSKEGTVEGAEKAAELLQKLEEMHSSGEIAKPDIFLYNTLMHAWQLCEQNNDDKSICYAEKAEDILDSICGGEDAELLPNDVSFSICIHAWSKSKHPDATERAEQILRRKEEFATKHSDIEIKSTDYNSIISSWKEDPAKGPERAARLFEEMVQTYGDAEERTRPTAATLNALLDVYAKSFERNLAGTAQSYLNRCNQLHKEGKSSILPDVISYRCVIDAWIRSWHKDSPHKVDALVKEMSEKHKHEGRTDLRPDTNSINLVLKACSHAPAVYKEKGNAGKGPDEHPIAIANRIFSLLKGKNEYDAAATHATYSYMFHIYRQHMDFNDKRYSPMVKIFWKHACRDGLVSSFSLNAFRDSVLEPDFWDAVGGEGKFNRLGKTSTESITIKDLPKEWSRNVSPLKRPVRWSKK